MFISDAQYQKKNMMRQRGNDSEFMAAPLVVSDEIVELDNGVLFARPLGHDSVMALITSGEQDEFLVESKENIRQSVVLSTLNRMNVTFSGEWVIETLTMSQATTLFSFLDYQAKSRGDLSGRLEDVKSHPALMHTERNLVVLIEKENKSMMGMLISTMLKPQDRRLESMFSFIRNVESYWISHFLLSQVMNEDKESDSHKIGNASKIYGVSESYFRKLCHHAFTRGPKKQLRLWRAAHSALQLIEKDNSISAIAGNNGYASSSHFSSEIKSLFGITPREFKKLEGLLHE